jgi:hypothetical protein
MIDIHFFSANAKVLKQATVVVKEQEVTDYTHFGHVKGPACVIVNAEDHGYCKVILDG